MDIEVALFGLTIVTTYLLDKQIVTLETAFIEGRAD
jgi:hypothetical protein